MTQGIREGLKKWFADYARWMTTHAYGLDEMNARNNHSVAYMVQRRVLYKMGLAFAVATIPGALVGARLVQYLDSRWFSMFFGIFLLLIAAVWAGDVAAFLSGSFFGRHKLYPKISPNKTFEGLAGAIAGSQPDALSFGSTRAVMYPGLAC